MHPHHVQGLATLGSASLTVADAAAGGNWQTVVINAGLTLLSTLLTTWLKNRAAKSAATATQPKSPDNGAK